MGTVTAVLSLLLLLAVAVRCCPSSCFCDDSTHIVSCVGDEIWTMPDDIPLDVVRLELRSFVIDTLHSGSLNRFGEHLTELKIQQAQVQNIENGTFGELSLLERLDLSQNNLVNLTDSMFHGLPRLKYLDLSSNHIEHFEVAFSELSGVEQLNLRDNHIRSLCKNSFRGLSRLQYLNLDSNLIAKLDADTFQFLTNLAHLILSNNPLNRFSKLDFFGSRLQYIDISNVGIDRIPQSLTQYVRDLRLARNNLTVIRRGDFDSYPYLSLLVVDDNALRVIDDDALGRQEYLSRLWLNGNGLKSVPSSLPPSLKALYLEENDIAELLPYSFRGLKELEQLFLQRNKIVNLEDCAFCDLVQLKNLDLQANLISVIKSGAFANLTSLQTLDLSQNPLKNLQENCFASISNAIMLQMSRMKFNITFKENMFDPLKNLQILELYDSSQFSQTILNNTRSLHSLRNIRELNIMHNNIAALRSDFPSFFPLVKVVKMNGNSWSCNSSAVLWLKKWLNNTDIQFYRSYSIRCATPEKLAFKPVMLLEEADFATPTTEQTTAATTTTTTTQYGPTPYILRIDENSTLPYIVSSFTNISLPDTASLNVFENGTLLHTMSRSETQTTEHTRTSVENINFPTTTTTTTTNEATKTVNVSSNPGASTTAEITENTKTEIVTEESEITTSTTRHWTSPALQRGVIEPLTPHLQPEVIRLHRHPDDNTVIVAATSVAGGLGILLLGIGVFVCLYRHKKSFRSFLTRSSSISYTPHKDEVSIVTVSEATDDYSGVGNRLYFHMEETEELLLPTS